MKTYLIAVISLALSAKIQSQDLTFTGSWNGTITIAGKGTSLSVRLDIDNRKVNQFYNDDRKVNHTGLTENHSTFRNGDLLYSFIKTTEFTSEAQTYTLTPTAKDMLSITWSRKCIVYTNKKGIADNAWTEQGSGTLTRVGSEITVSVQ